MSRDGALAVSTLHYADEILSSGATAVSEVFKEEEDSVKKSITAMMADFAPEKYANIRREKILGIINKKIKKKDEVVAPELEEEDTTEGIADLMSALEKKKACMPRERAHDNNGNY
jgi:non-homologous end joining protein Ku